MMPLSRMLARPLRIDISILDYCNLHCPHCGRQASNIEVDRNFLLAKDLERIAPWFKQAMYVTLVGWGEPFMNKDLFRIIDLIQSNGATVSLISNGTLIDEKAARQIIGPRPLLLNLSIDAGSPEIFEKVRAGARFDQVVANIDRLVALKKQAGAIFPIININMTLMKDTLGEIRKVIDLAKRWEGAVVRTQTILFFEDSADRSQAVTNLEAQKALADAEPYARELGIELRYAPLGSDFETLQDDEKQGDVFAPSYEGHHHGKAGSSKNRFFCSNLWHHLDIDVFGNVGYCCMADFGMPKLGNIRDMDPGKLWNHPDMANLRSRIAHGDPPKECLKCWALEQFGRRKAFNTWRAEFKNLG